MEQTLWPNLVLRGKLGMVTAVCRLAVMVVTRIAGPTETLGSG